MGKPMLLKRSWLTCWLLMLLTGSSFAQNSTFTELPFPLQERPIDVCRQIITSQDREMAVFIERIGGLEQQIVTQAATIKAWETRASGKMSKKDWLVLSLTVLAGVGTIVGR